jgi:hypothetical protein
MSENKGQTNRAFKEEVSLQKITPLNEYEKEKKIE